ncbi:unnamed protein product [Rotaria magnacalcarata]|uniref:Uncharacterized protein n=1 Tax=Rotaria magnacalcarata TaxID=392030 RepID=A0A819K5F2_9BILA|nr:unnamed protein product [Rotaria magnacalcarata]CAF2072380.1 unnamed protein product [Rotaria magnacalcarata]CAF3940133.1 unnamed protein product [Rotaria magnacalcarata]CAF4019500.1 unnamed protein product [Rotaria magnacalcarata]
MNSGIKFAFLCVSAALLCNSVQSRAFRQFASKREGEKNPLCELVIAIMDAVIRGANLDLTPEQEALLPSQGSKREEGADECKEEQAQWLNSMTPFLSSLSEEQKHKLEDAFKVFTEDADKTERGLALAQGLFKRTMNNQRRNYNRFIF